MTPTSMGEQADHVLGHGKIAAQGAPALPAAEQHGDGFNQAPAIPVNSPRRPATAPRRLASSLATCIVASMTERVRRRRPNGQGLIDGRIHLEPEPPVQGGEHKFFLVGEVPGEGGRSHPAVAAMV